MTTFLPPPHVRMTASGENRSPLYWAAGIGAFVLLAIGIAGDGAAWTNVGALLPIVVAVVVRPGGIRGPDRRS